VSAASNPDQVANEIRERLNSAADRLRAAAAGRGAFVDPHAVNLAITVTIMTLEAAQSQLRRDVLKRTP
jgi:hypothetical protein